MYDQVMSSLTLILSSKNRIKKINQKGNENENKKWKWKMKIIKVHHLQF